MAAQSDLERAMARLTTDLVELIRIAVTDAIAESLPAPTPARGRGAARGRPAAAPARTGRRGRPPGRRAGGGGGGGGASDIEAQILRALERANGSLSASEIQDQLRAEAGPVRYAIKKLKSAGQVKQEGERRGARYTAA